MSSTPPALLIDDGELALVRALLEDIAADFWHLRGSKAEPPIQFPSRLLIASGHAALGLPCQRARRGDGMDATWMAVVQADSKSQRGILRNNGFDFLIPEAVHPAALRLLLMRALFDGANTQEVDRVAVGQEIRVGTALRSHSALLVDLSPRGCRYLSDRAPRVGARVGLQIPVEDDTLSLDGVVTRANPAVPEGGEAGQTSVGIRFRPMRRKQIELLKEVLRSCRNGPVPLAPDTSYARPALIPPPDGHLDPPSTGPGTPEPERLLPRGVFEVEVDASSAGATRRVVGRDLSEKGMLIEPNPSLRVGQRVRLFLYGAAREEPMLVEAHVGRDDGERGLALYFDWIERDALERLRRLVQTLPPLRRLDGEPPTGTAVLTQLLPRLKRSR